MASEETKQNEVILKSHPHPDFKKVESSRPAFPASTSFHYTQTPLPTWTYGSGANHLHKPGPHKLIDPCADGRPPHLNYKLLISAVTPRPIALISTRSADGKVENLAPFSYFQLISHDPPLFVVGVSTPSPLNEGADVSKSKDTLRLLCESNECVVNMVGEHMIEAVNATSVNAPFAASEWAVSGLTPVYDCETVKAARVRESMFSIEAKLESTREFASRSGKGRGSTMVVLEGTRFWARGDVVDEEGSLLTGQGMKAVGRLGGITYGRVGEVFELPRPDWEGDVGGREGFEKAKARRRESHAEGEVNL